MATNPTTFDPQTWLDRFEHVGGGWMVRDCLSLVILVEGRSEAELSRARQLVVDLTAADRKALVEHLRGCEALPSGEA